DAIVRYLKDEDPSTRDTALRALDAVWRDGDSDVVLNLESHDADGDIRKEAGWILRRHLPANPRPLLQRWLWSEIPRERVWAAEFSSSTPSLVNREETAGTKVWSRLRLRRNTNTGRSWVSGYLFRTASIRLSSLVSVQPARTIGHSVHPDKIAALLARSSS